ncbi:hypothetical protein AtNW77_Chr5g0086491 [Arabidopsis thaliana]
MRFRRDFMRLGRSVFFFVTFGFSCDYFTYNRRFPSQHIFNRRGRNATSFFAAADFAFLPVPSSRMEAVLAGILTKIAFWLRFGDLSSKSGDFFGSGDSRREKKQALRQKREGSPAF